MFNIVNIIPTGVGAAIGGFAGDANPVNTVLESIADQVITHPNAVNAASLYAASQKTLYVEGWALDRFLEGKLNLKKTFNKIGIIIDRQATPKITDLINAVNACLTVFGAQITGYVITEEIIGPVVTKKDNLFSGEIKNPETMFQAAAKLISLGATALAVFTVLENPFSNFDQDYLQGKGVDPIGRLEAIISHLLVEKYQIPCAHAPIFLETWERELCDPRVASEEIGFTYIPCVIRGLQFAPAIVPNTTSGKNCFSVDDVDVVIAPYDCFKGIWLKPCLERNIPVIGVKENKTALEDTPERLGIADKIIIAENYLEVIGIISALKSKVSYQSLRRPITGIKEIS